MVSLPIKVCISVTVFALGALEITEGFDCGEEEILWRKIRTYRMPFRYI